MISIQGMGWVGVVGWISTKLGFDYQGCKKKRIILSIQKQDKYKAFNLAVSLKPWPDLQRLKWVVKDKYWVMSLFHLSDFKWWCFGSKENWANMFVTNYMGKQKKRANCILFRIAIKFLSWRNLAGRRTAQLSTCLP